MCCYHSTTVEATTLLLFIVQLVRFDCEFWIWCFCDDFTKDIDSKQNHHTNIISKTHSQNQQATLYVQWKCYITHSRVHISYTTHASVTTIHAYVCTCIQYIHMYVHTYRHTHRQTHGHTHAHTYVHTCTYYNITLVGWCICNSQQCTYVCVKFCWVNVHSYEKFNF